VDPTSIQNKGFRKGDVIVTAVAHHYAIGRIGADGRTQQHLASEKDREIALALACQFARAAHRVFLYQSAGDSTFAPCDCQKIRSSSDRHVKTSTHQRARSARQSAADGSATAGVPVTERVGTEPPIGRDLKPVRSWRRLHSSNIVCQVEPMHGLGLWTASAWLTSDPSAIARTLRPVTLLTAAQAKADDLARQAFAHTCDDGTCGDWLPVQGS
jgi:hypothetical protein